MEETYILGVRHIKVMCNICREYCWTQPMPRDCWQHYQCKTCTEPKEIGVGRTRDAIEDMRFD